MNKIRRTLVVVLLGMVMLGLGMTTAVSAVKPPPPTGGYPDAVRIYPPWDGNVIYRSDASFFLAGWFYWVEPGYDETELFPQPIRVQLWIGGQEIKLSRVAVGHGNLDGVLPPEWVDYAKGPLFRWYAYFEPYSFAAGEYVTHIKWTCKDPDSPSDWIVIDYPGEGLYEAWGLLTVLDG